MLRKLLMAAVLMFFTSIASASAAGDVEVHNPGMFTVTGENTFTFHGVIHGTSTEVTGWRCENLWEANVGELGEVHVHDIQMDEHPDTPSTPNCGPLEACDEWDGQIEETHGLADWEYALELNFCIQGQGGELSGVPKHIECRMAADEAHCGESPWEEETFIGEHQVAPGVFVDFYVEGEVFLDRPLELEHHEA